MRLNGGTKDIKLDISDQTRPQSLLSHPNLYFFRGGQQNPKGIVSNLGDVLLITEPE